MPSDEARYLAAMEIVACELCDDDGYRNSRVCDHVDHAAAAARGIAKVRAALAAAQQRKAGNS